MEKEEKNRRDQLAEMRRRQGNAADQKAAAAKKAFLTTRVGDVFLMVGLFMLYDLYHSLEFAVIFGDPTLGGAVHGADLQWPLFFMFIGCVGKSAQFPLHVWLPDTMDSPTPVSALMHAGIINAGGFF